ncbi:cell division protein ZapE [Alphaproteobacteria bacterium]|nr:cell division protein ZapE [Alphaproteobacteria bacterium]MDC1085931.1 cell division protein ZapE [Alphaproteobacteria bacterium]
MTGNLKTYQNKSLKLIAESKSINFDDGQMYVARIFDALLRKTNNSRRNNIFTKIFANKNINGVKGIYLHGGVGRGKSMIMDLFFQSLDMKNKRRLHFHDFMKEVHQRILEKSKVQKDKDSVVLVGQDLAKSAKLLCFDEMEVKDIADAMILSRLFDVMFNEGTILVTTSNQSPDGLYKNGLHRDRILPFIENLKVNTDVIEIPDGNDWRNRSLSGNRMWLSPISKINYEKIDKIFEKLSLGFEIRADTIDVAGRKIFIPKVAASIARIDFDDLCNKPLAASDYIEIALRYKGIILDNIPILNDKMRNETRRFIWLIDALYDKNCFLIASSQTNFTKIYKGQEWEFEFQRTVSRITEMTQL